jgi:predicted AlkP superfamily pyrophosphatase or phosphodiesterase
MNMASIKVKILIAKLSIVSVCFLALLGVAHPSAPAQTAPATENHVIIISIDGLMPDYYLSTGQIGMRLPNLTRMKLNGAYAEGVQSVYPSVTYPAHTTMVTGVRPATHGIEQNRIFEAPDKEQTR